MLKRFVPTLIVVAVTMVLTTLLEPLSFLRAFAQQDSCRYFPQTGRIVCGKFLKFWEENGGLPAFGYPISNRFPQRSALDDNMYETQYFEHGIFELHPQNAPPHDVQLAHAGVAQLNSRFPDGNPLATYPIYPNGENFTHKYENRSFIWTFTTRFQTNDSPAAVHGYFERILQEGGWKQVPSRQSGSVSYRLVDPWEIPECEPDFSGPRVEMPCASSYLLELTVARNETLTTVVETLEHDTFCCFAARTE